MKVQVIFIRCVQNSHFVGTNNEHMISLLYAIIEGNTHEIAIRHPHGGDHSYEEDPIEVEISDELRKIVHYGEIRDESEKYYRMLVGENGSAIKIKNSTVFMMGNTFNKTYKTSVSPPGMSGAW